MMVGDDGLPPEGPIVQCEDGRDSWAMEVSRVPCPGEKIDMMPEGGILYVVEDVFWMPFSHKFDARLILRPAD